MPRPKTVIKAAVLLIVAALLLPFVVNVNRFRAQVVRALEAGLGRPVEARNLRLKLVSGPGFELENVTIGDDPSFGIEPLARMPALRATLRLRSLWTGRLSFSSVVFVEPSVNVARRADGHWNIEPVLARAAATSRTTAAPPYIELQDARINFKSSDTKSVFFLSEVDAAIYATSEGGGRRLHLRFSGSPARTDRRLTDVGSLRAEGSMGPVAPAVRLELDLQDAYLADLSVLASGTDRGIHGVMNVSTRFEGEPSALKSSGSVRLRDVHHWDMLPPEGGSRLDLQFEALVNAPARSADITHLRANLREGVLEGTGRVEQPLGNARWRFSAGLSGARLANVVWAAKHLSPRVPRDVSADGRLEADFMIAGPPLAITGFVAARDIELRDAPAGAVLQAPTARVNFIGNAWELDPVAFTGRGRNLTVSARWDWQDGTGDFSAAGRELPVGTVNGLLQAAGADFLPRGAVARDGRAALALHASLSRAAPPRWNGWSQLSRVHLQPESAPPVTIHNARLDFQTDQLRASGIVATWNGATITGDVRTGSAAAAPFYNAAVRVTEIDAPALAAALAYATAPRNGAGGPPVPLRSEGTISIGRLRLRRLELEQLESGYRLDGKQLDLSNARAFVAGGAVQGSAAINLSGPTPSYKVDARVRDAMLQRLAAISPELQGVASGLVSGTVQLAASGWQPDTVLETLTGRLRLQGTDLVMRDIDLETFASRQDTPRLNNATTEEPYKFTADLSVGERHVRLQNVVLARGPFRFTATGAVGFDRLTDITIVPLVTVGAPGRTIPAAAGLRPFRLAGPLELPRTRPLAQ